MAENTIIHEISLAGYKATSTGGMLDLGTWGSYGIEKLHLTLDAAWQDLTITAFFNVKGEVVGKALVGKDGYADVPWEATKENTFAGRIVFEGSMNNQRRISANLNFKVTNHSEFEDSDPVPTDDRWNQFVTQNKEYRDGAYEAAERANARAEDAEVASEGAQAAARAAKASESAADTLAAKAERAAQEAENSNTAANNAAYLAGENATAAQQAAENAAAAANYAGQSASDAAASKAAAETAAQAAQEAQAAAAAARDAAAGSAEAAAKSEENAKQSANTLAESVENVVANTAAVAELKQQVANITPDDSTIGDKPWSSKHIIDMLFPPLEESGNPVVCYPVAGYPLGVKASWEPVQEGTGTPYPAGGGKNLFNPAWMPEKAMSYGVTWTITPDGTVAANGTASGTTYYNSDNFLLPAGTYTISAMSHFRVTILNKDTNDTITAQNVGQPCTFTVENDIQNANLFFAASGTLDNVSAKPQIEKGATATAYAPYENIRPITGRASVKVERCGENLLRINPFNKFTKNGITYEYVPDGGIHISGTATTTVDSPTFPVWLLPPGKYFGLELSSGISASIVVQRNGKNLWLNAKGAFEILAGDVTKYWYAIASAGATVDKTVYPYIVPGTTAPTTYKPYIGQTNTLTLPETVYEGEVDAVNGEGQETWKMLTLDGTTNKFTQSDRFWRMQSNTAPGVVNGYVTMCSHFPANTFGGNQTGNYIFTRADIMSRYFPDVNALNTYIAAQYAAGTPVQICYKLAEPVPFTATGAQPIPALAGANTVLTDADTVEVTGRADMIKRITDLEDAVASQT